MGEGGGGGGDTNGTALLADNGGRHLDAGFGEGYGSPDLQPIEIGIRPGSPQPSRGLGRSSITASLLLHCMQQHLCLWKRHSPLNPLPFRVHGPRFRILSPELWAKIS
jgi:hypothetical protein